MEFTRLVILALIIFHCSLISSFCLSDRIISSPWISDILSNAALILSIYLSASGLLFSIVSDTSFIDSAKISEFSLYFSVRLSTYPDTSADVSPIEDDKPLIILPIESTDSLSWFTRSFRYSDSI